MVLSLFSTRIQIICTVNDLDFNYQNTKFTCHCTGLMLLPLPDWWSWERKFHSCVSCMFELQLIYCDLKGKFYEQWSGLACALPFVVIQLVMWIFLDRNISEWASVLCSVVLLLHFKNNYSSLYLMYIVRFIWCSSWRGETFQYGAMSSATSTRWIKRCCIILHGCWLVVYVYAPFTVNRCVRLIPLCNDHLYIYVLHCACCIFSINSDAF